MAWQAAFRAPWRSPAVQAAALGGLVALGQAPWGLWPLALLAMAGVITLIMRAPGAGAGFVRGWAAGAGCFALAMVWIIEPFLIDAGRHGWMAPFALVLMAGGLALFWGAAAALAVWAAPGRVARAAAFCLAFLAFEALRGHLFTGFPWAMLGHIWIDTPVAQAAALTGGLGLSALALGLSAAGALTVLRLGQGHHGRAVAVLAVLVMALGAVWGWGAARLAEPGAAPRDLRLRLVQPDAPQALKWDHAFAEYYFYRHLDLSAAESADGRAPDLVIWSETAVPFFLDSAGDGLAMAAASTGGAPLVLGIQRRALSPQSGPQYFNSLAVLDEAGTPVAVYDKHHLVPFGEYVPLIGHYAERPGFEWLAGFAAQALLGYTPGPGPALIDLGPAGRALPLICYEAIFPRNLRGTARPDWLLQITNDAWFGDRIGPYQHLAQARLRAIEQGLPLVRSANTGVSAVIDARGQVVASLGMNRAGNVDADLPGPLAPTPYARHGDTPWHAGLVLGLVLLAGLRWRRNRLTHGH